MPHFLPFTKLLPGVIVGLVLAGGCAHRHGCKQKPSPTGKRAGYPDGYCAGYYPTCWRRWPDDCPSCPVDLGEVMPAESLPPGERPEAGEEIPTVPYMPTVPYDPSPDAGSSPVDSDAAPTNGMEPPEGDSSLPEAPLPDEAPPPDEVPPPDDDTSTTSKAKGSLVRNERAPQGAPPPSIDQITLAAKRRPPAKPAPMILITQPDDRVVPRRDVPKGKARRPNAKAGTAASSTQAPIMNPYQTGKNRDPDEAVARCTDKPRVERAKSSKSNLKRLFARSKPAPDDEVEKAASVVVRESPRNTEPSGYSGR